MIKNPIYQPKGKAADYGEYAVNIYEGCPGGCEYCYAPMVLRKNRESFHAMPARRRDGVEGAVVRQLEKGGFEGKTVHLCFTCDPYPAGTNTMPTAVVIKLLKKAGCHVQILTKNPQQAIKDIGTLGAGDRFGVSLTWADDIEPGAETTEQRIEALRFVKRFKPEITTWVSIEPVFYPHLVYEAIRDFDFIDLWKFGKLNYAHLLEYREDTPPQIVWHEYGREAERLCIEHGRNYQIKSDLREAMQ